MTQKLTKGQNAILPVNEVVISLDLTAPADLSGLLVTASGKVRTDDDFVFYNQPTGPGVRLQSGPPGQPDELAVSLTTIPADIDQIRAIITLDDATASFGRYASPTARVCDTAGNMLYEYRIDGLDTESIVIALELYRWQHSWKVRAIGQGYTGGFAALVTDHGVEVDDAPTLTPALDGVTPNMKPLADSCHDLDDADRTPKRYLTRRDIAEMLGVKHTTITGYDERGLLPEPDIILGRAKGWAEETIREWDAARPGRGVRTDRDPEAVKAREKKLELNRRLAEASAVKTAERKAAAAGADPDVTTAPAASR